jgi:hypothetical protein
VHVAVAATPSGWSLRPTSGRAERSINIIYIYPLGVYGRNVDSHIRDFRAAVRDWCCDHVPRGWREAQTGVPYSRSVVVEQGAVTPITVGLQDRHPTDERD